MSFASVENNTSNWVSFSSAGALDARSVPDEMRRIVGSSAPNAVIVSDKERNGGCKKKDRDHVEFLCEVYEGQVARGRNQVLPY